MQTVEKSDRMAAEISDHVRETAEVRGPLEPELSGRTLGPGLEDLWEDLVLAQYLKGELDREEAIEHVGRTKVERAEREREVVESDRSKGTEPRGTRGQTKSSGKSHLSAVLHALRRVPSVDNRIHLG